MTAGLGLRGQAGDTRGGGPGRDQWRGGGSCRDWVTVTLETPGHRVSESGLLDAGAPLLGAVRLGVALLWPRGRSQAGLKSTSGWSHQGASFRF